MSETKRLDEAVAPLVQRARAGDGAARDELLSRCHATIYRWALVCTGDPDDADDVAQEVLVRLCTRLHRYAGESRFTTWLYRVTRNTAFSLGRRLVSRARAVQRAGADPESAAEEDPIERLHASRVGEVVAELFSELPARQRDVFHLADVEGVPATEIAARLGMRPVTVRVHLLRARRALRSRILARHPEIAEERSR
ncbi:MAG: RNA polymerase sigma factor [Gemmatimonadales bacterium]